MFLARLRAAMPVTTACDTHDCATQYLYMEYFSTGAYATKHVPTLPYPTQPCPALCSHRYGLSAITLREVASELEERAAQRLDQVGGEGLQGAAARAGLHDALGESMWWLP